MQKRTILVTAGTRISKILVSVNKLEHGEQIGRSHKEAPRSGRLLAVKELRISLDPNRDAEICEQLEGLYLFCEDELARATDEADVAGLENAAEVLSILKEAWLEAGACVPKLGESAA